MKRISFVLLAVCFALAGSALAQTYYVGSCHGVGYATISAAVASVPSGATIKVCPGNYTEQVVITKPLTLTGVVAAGSAASTIYGSTSDPAFGGYNGSAVRPSILVQAGPVNISDINIYAIYQTSDCVTMPTGIAYISGSWGTVNHVNAAILPAETGGCSPSVGVWIENENMNVQTAVTVENSTIEVEDTGIWAYSGQQAGFAPITTLTATGNMIFAVHTNSVGAGLNVEMATGTVSANIIRTGFTGIYLNTNAAFNVTGNSVDSITGVLVDQAGPTITTNKIRAVTGLNLNCHQATVTGNTFFGGRGGLASTAIQYPPAALAGTNTFYNIATQKSGGC